MLLQQQIDIDLRNATYSKDKILLETIRAIKNQFVVELKTGRRKDNFIPNNDAYQILRGMIKQRKESEAIYLENKREDLAQIERKQIEIIEKYVPEEISDSQLRAEIITLIGKTGVEKSKQIGVLLKATIPVLDGVASRERISKMAKGLLEAYEKQKRN